MAVIDKEPSGIQGPAGQGPAKTKELSPEEKKLFLLKNTQELSTMYLEDETQSSFNALICGESGSGKTYLARTCRFPVHIDSFDPGGTQGLRDLIQSKDIIADVRWEKDDPKKPHTFKEWKKVFDERVESGYFDFFGTYILDSATTWSEAIMNYILDQAKRPGEAPKWEKDYTPAKLEVRNMLQKMLNLPCDFFLIGHLAADKDEVSGRTTYRFMATGNHRTIIPLLFSEVYVCLAESKGQTTERKILTEKDSLYLARTRIGARKFQKYEEPNIKAMLKKAGFPCEDKENLFK